MQRADPCINWCADSPRPSPGERAQDGSVADGLESCRGGEAWLVPLPKSNGCGVLVSLPFYIIYRFFEQQHIIKQHSLRTRGCALTRVRKTSSGRTGHPPRQDGPLSNHPIAGPCNPLGKSAPATRHWGCCGSSLPSCVRPSVMPDASWLLTEGRKPPPRPMKQLSAPAQRCQFGFWWRGSHRSSRVSAAC